MKTTRESRSELRKFAESQDEMSPLRGVLICCLDDLDEAEARAERLQVICDKMSTALHEMRTSYRQNQHAQEWADFMVAALAETEKEKP